MKGYVSVLYKVMLEDSDELSERNIVSFSPYSRENVVLLNQKYENNPEGKLKISLHMSMKYTHAALLTAISNDFSSYY